MAFEAYQKSYCENCKTYKLYELHELDPAANVKCKTCPYIDLTIKLRQEAINHSIELWR